MADPIDDIAEASSPGEVDERTAAMGAEDVEPELSDEDFKRLWKTLRRLPGREVIDRVERQLEETPQARREVLTAWLAQQLGYSRVWRTQNTLLRQPLWELLKAGQYRHLSVQGEQALAMIGRTAQSARSFIHPSVALATVALWRHSDDNQLVEEATERLEAWALPAKPEWLYEVVGAFLDDDSVEKPNRGRSLRELVELVLDCRYWEVGALLAGTLMVHRYGRWYHSPAESALTHACDVAARQYPADASWWLDVLAEAAMGGHLRFRWLEEPVQAAIRMNIDDPHRQQQLRRYLRGRPFDADYQRLEALYDTQLKLLGQTGSEAVRRRLLVEVRRTAERHPARALRLLELMVLHSYGPRIGSRFYRLRKAIDRLGEDQDEELCAWLVGMYVNNAKLQPHAAALVRRVGDEIDWESNPFANRQAFETYLVISDYDRAFEELTCKFDGVTLEHADKHAAARIKFFVQKRVNPSRIHRMVQSVFRPVEWLGAGLTEIGPVSDAIERGMERFEEKVRSESRRQDVVGHFRQAGVLIGSFDDIAELPAVQVERVVDRLCSRRLVLGALAGGVSGGLAPYSWGVLSLADIPIMLALTTDVCSRFCWYYGFDPGDHPDLPFEILAVALGGTRPEAIEPMLVRQNLHSHVVRKSIVVGALAHGGVTHLTGKGLSRLLQRRVEKTAFQRASSYAQRLVGRNLKHRAARTRTPRGMPLVGAALGAALNTVLMYDVCEAAQAVLTDRFLERKYPEWIRHIERISTAESP